MTTFGELTQDQISRNNAGIRIPYHVINFLPIVKVTEKAICVQVDNSSWVHESIKNVWLPISQIEIEKVHRQKNFVDSNPNDDKDHCFIFQISVPNWLLKRNKLI